MNVNWITQLKFELQKGDVNFPVVLCRMNKLAHINRIPLISYCFGCNMYSKIIWVVCIFMFN